MLSEHDANVLFTKTRPARAGSFKDWISNTVLPVIRNTDTAPVVSDVEVAQSEQPSLFRADGPSPVEANLPVVSAPLSGQLVIRERKIREDEHGRVCLNDIYAAEGSPKTNRHTSGSVLPAATDLIANF